NGIDADTEWRVNYMEREKILRDVARAKELADFVIVSAHWGWDDIFEIDGFQREYAGVFAEAGVDLVVGTGPHLIQHIEWIDREDGGKMLCAFSLGNYVSGMLGAFNELTGVLKLDFVLDVDGGRRIENVEFVPLVMHKEPSETVMHVYPLGEYTDALAARSSVNHYRGGLSVSYLHRILHEQIADEFLPAAYRGKHE
ncbi:MAG: CapA family protein, partial [Bacillota bacterium]|nr:CapA family protein [Bacillota bacterium]